MRLTGELAGGSMLIFEDDFDEDALDLGKWYPGYLPHWSDPTSAAARYAIRDSVLRLQIAEDQAPWCPEFDGPVKVSNLQTGHHAGALGSKDGQHRFHDRLVVRSVLPEMRLFLPHYGRLEMRARARLNPWNLAALWLIGFEDRPERSGEITVFEAFGHNVSPDGARIGRGIKKIRDPQLFDEVDEGYLPIDVKDWHSYAIDWSPSGVAFLVDDRVVTRTRQSPDYPMQLMLNLYDLPKGEDRGAGTDAWFDIDFIRAYRNAR